MKEGYGKGESEFEKKSTYSCWFEYEGRGHKPRIAGGPYKLERARKQFLSRVSNGKAILPTP